MLLLVAAEQRGTRGILRSGPGLGGDALDRFEVGSVSPVSSGLERTAPGKQDVVG